MFYFPFFTLILFVPLLYFVLCLKSNFATFRLTLGLISKPWRQPDIIFSFQPRVFRGLPKTL